MRRLCFAWLLLAGMLLFTGTFSPAQDMKKTEPKFPTEVEGKSLDAWVKEMRDSKDPGIRERAIKIIPQFDPKIAIPKVSKTILFMMESDKDYSVRMTAVSAAPFLLDYTEAEKGVTVLDKTIRGNQLHARYEAIQALGNCGDYGKTAIPAIVDFGLKDATSWQMRKACCNTLGKIGRGDDAEGPSIKAMDGLIASLNDVSTLVRREAAQAILQLGAPKKREDWVRLQKALQAKAADPDKSFSLWVNVCLMRISDKMANERSPEMQIVARYLKDPDVTLRSEAIAGLAIMSDEASYFIPDLRAIVDNPKEETSSRTYAIWALSQMRRSAGDLVPYFEKLKADPKENTDIKYAANEAIETVTGKKDPKMEKKEEKKEMPKKK